MVLTLRDRGVRNSGGALLFNAFITLPLALWFGHVWRRLMVRFFDDDR